MVSTKDLPKETLSALLDASTAINAAQGLNETLQAIARAAAAVMRAEGSSVILLDKPRGKQVFLAAVGDHAEQLIGVEYDAGVGLSGQAIAHQKAQIHNDVAREKAHFKDIDARIAFQTRSLIAAPLIHKDQVLGVVEVVNPVGAERFNENDRELAQIFANLAAIATANAQRFERINRENRGLKETLRGSGQMLGQSPAMQKVMDLIGRVSPSNATVLLLGESGVGKELAARSIHEKSPRHDRAFVAVNCAALPETLLESELFGHEAGAFTGATGQRLGRFELADEGTIFLDEIGEVAPAIQVKLLRVLQEKEFVRVGGTRTIGCDVRVIAASNRDLEAEKNHGRFREDLYYRLNVFPIVIPPLRDRREDIPLLVGHFLRRLARDMNIEQPKITDSAMGALARYDYPGNIRELQNLLERACLLAEKNLIDLPQLPADIAAPGDESTRAAEAATRGLPTTKDGPGAPSALATMEKALILKALEENNYNQTRAAESLGINRDSLRYRIKKYGIVIRK